MWHIWMFDAIKCCWCSFHWTRSVIMNMWTWPTSFPKKYGLKMLQAQHVTVPKIQCRLTKRSLPEFKFWKSLLENPLHSLKVLDTIYHTKYTGIDCWHAYMKQWKSGESTSIFLIKSYLPVEHLEFCFIFITLEKEENRLKLLL